VAIILIFLTKTGLLGIIVLAQDGMVDLLVYTEVHQLLPPLLLVVDLGRG
jgi:hypothetical protein